ncbi:MAG: hypothetical protein ACLQVA_04695 [Candidatus Brocadiia bacterium]
MTRRLYGGAICGLLLAGILPCSFSIAQGQTNDAATAGARMDPALAREWMQRWKETILRESRTRWCDQVMGEAIADVVGGPFLSGFCQGYMATGDREWVDRFIDWTDSVVKRGVKEPDGYIGWPRDENGDVLEYLPDGMKERYTDTEVGDAWFFRPIVLMAGEILKSPALKKEYGAKAEEYIRLAERTFEKWESRGAWRETKDGGGVWVIPPFGIDRRTGQWTEGYEQRKTDGVSMPDNKENSITLWMIAMYDVTQKPIYRERVEKWMRVQKSRMRLRENGKYFVWNYWDPAGPWDYKPDGSLKHWVGVHPNGRYYRLDVDAIAAAWEHGLVFTKEDIARLIATNRDFMWNQQLKNPEFQRIDGEKPAARVPPGLLWTALAPYDPTLRKLFEIEATADPASWEGLGFVATPAWVARFGPKREAGR